MTTHAAQFRVMLSIAGIDLTTVVIILCMLSICALPFIHGLDRDRVTATPFWSSPLLKLALAVFAVTILLSILISYLAYDGRSPDLFSSFGLFVPLMQAVCGPPLLALVMPELIVPLAITLSIMVYSGLRRRRLWPLTLLGLICASLCWLGLVYVLSSGMLSD